VDTKLESTFWWVRVRIGSVVSQKKELKQAMVMTGWVEKRDLVPSKTSQKCNEERLRNQST